MTCVISGTSLKIFGKAIHALDRIAHNVYIEALPSGLVLRTINSSHSAYVCFTFKPGYFLTYQKNSKRKCKLLLKSFLSAFHSMPTLEKVVEKCLLDLSMDDFLLLQFFCKHDMTKTYNLPLIEYENLHASMPTTGFHCKITALSRLLHDGIQNFTNSMEEVTLSICSNKVVLKNYVEDESDRNKVVQTELTLELDEFISHDIKEEAEVTFSLKDFRVLLNFSEGFNVPISIQCEVSGKPIVLGIEGLQHVEAEFVMATLADLETQLTASSRSTHKLSLQTQVSLTGSNVQQKESRKLPSIDLSESNDSITNLSSFQIPPEVEAEVPEPSMPKRHMSETLGLSDEEDAISFTPPKKKFRSAFLGLSQSTYTSMAPDPDEVLAPDSD